MAVTVQSVGDLSESAAASITVDAPTGVAQGDLLIVHCGRANDTPSTPSGWTLVQAGNNGGNVGNGVFYRIAQAGDVGQASFSLNFDGSTSKVARMFRITGHNPSNPINTSAIATGASATITVGSVTPTVANCLFMFFAAVDTAAGGTPSVSGYTMVTSSPTYSEHYDQKGAGDGSDAHFSAASGLRTATTATGNNTATPDRNDDWVGIVVAVEPEVINVTVTPAVVTGTFNVIAPTVSGGANVNPAVVTAALSVQAPTVTTAAPEWTNPDKTSAPTWTNPDKS